jgi:DEAD/DEAH box helicase domain-containing protein
VGLAASAFEKSEKLFAKTLEMIKACPCENGCPACVHSPKCGSGNRPIDKQAAIFVLETLKNGDKPLIEPLETQKAEEHKKNKSQKKIRFGVLDLETRRSAEEVGGWGNAAKMGVSCVVVYDSMENRYHEYLGEETDLLINHLKQLDLVIGFNIIRFDYLVLQGCSSFDFHGLPTLDILADIHKRLGYRLSLDRVGEATLGVKKSGDGLQALQWWKEGKIRDIIDYCIKDVEITKDLYLYGLNQSYLLFRNKAGDLVRLPVDW